MGKKKINTSSAKSTGSGTVGASIRERWNELSNEERAAFDKELDGAFPCGFSIRDEANALIAIAVRNGPIEALHAGKHSPLVEDPSLSRITDAEMKEIMINATRMLAKLLELRDEDPEFYGRYVRTCGRMYCQSWEREQ